jgi:hypothetical protein
MSEKIKTVKDVPADYQFISDSQDTKFFQEYYHKTAAAKCDSFFVRLDESGTEYESIYGITGIVPHLEKTVYKIL